MATAICKRTSGHGPRRGGPSAIRNPHARPKRQRQPPVLPPVEERPQDYDGVRFMLQRGEDPPGIEVIGGSVWELVYRCRYRDGVCDEIARFQLVIARTRADAVRVLQGLMYGFARSIILYNVRSLGGRSRFQYGPDDR